MGTHEDQGGTPPERPEPQGPQESPASRAPQDRRRSPDGPWSEPGKGRLFEPAQPDQRPRDVGPGDRSFLAVSGGVVLGFLIAFAFPMVLADTGLPIPLLILAPPALGLIALLVPAWRRAGAGFVMGLAIGSVVFAGVCAAFVSYLSISLGA